MLFVPDIKGNAFVVLKLIGGKKESKNMLKNSFLFLVKCGYDKTEAFQEELINYRGIVE